MSGIVLGMVGLGAYSRLNNRGITMIKSNLLKIQAPSSEEEWEKEYQIYANHPQFKKDFPNMSMDEFMNIYNIQHLHANLGRALGAIFLFPFIYFTSRRIMKFKLVLSTLGIFSLPVLHSVKSILIGKEYIK